MKQARRGFITMELAVAALAACGLIGCGSAGNVMGYSTRQAVAAPQPQAEPIEGIRDPGGNLTGVRDPGGNLSEITARE